jgi:CPA2 family monovalent cation:H+ antiporter-2
MARKLEARTDPLATLPMSVDQSRLTGQVVVVGYGRVGRRIAEALQEKQIHYVVVEQHREIIEALRQRDIAAVCGDAADPATLIQAHIMHASMLVIAIPDAFDVRKMVDIARTLNPAVETVIRTHNETEALLLQQENIGTVFMGEHELARGMTGHVLTRLGHRAADAPH